MEFLAQMGLGLVLAMAVLGSALGIGAAGRAAAGAWAKEGREGKPFNFKYIIFVSAPLTQTLYALAFMVLRMKTLAYGADAAKAGLIFGIAVAAGLGEFISAWMQGLVGAAACRCMSESEGKGLGLLIVAIGIAESVGLFTWVFLLLM